jgi:hypothetical protein
MIGRLNRQGRINPVFFVDEQFAEEVSKHSWCRHAKGYLQTRINDRMVLLHRFIWALAHENSAAQLDHINGVKWDCRLTNLRPATGSLNIRNRNSRRRLADRAHLPAGVEDMRLYDSIERDKPYRVVINVHGRRKYLGYFATAEEAGAAYQQAKASEMAQEETRSWELFHQQKESVNG